VFRSGEAKGPYTRLQLWEIQDITARTKVRRGEAEWQRAGEIPELAAYLTQKSGAIPKKLFSAGLNASGQLEIFRSNRIHQSRYIMSDRLTIISRSGRVFEMVNYWQVLLANPPLQKSRSLDLT
jgi:hypothetical protein